VSVRLGPLLENDLLYPATYVAVNVLSLSTKQIVATNVWLHVDMTQKPLTIDGANLLALRSERAYRHRDALIPVLEASEYADRLWRLIASEQELPVHVGTTSGSA
jgi:hypothetical protein